jgi:peptidyl-prolyl cis-trans isomerase B (cyclophilin B)
MAESPRAVIETSKGEIEIELLPDKAPGHVKNFVDLAQKGFYDGTTFHRVIPGFMIQGGDPNTRDAKHGVLSMARAGDPNSAGSQFFICVADAAFLDRQYSAFGRVVRGMEVADAIVSAKRDAADNPNDRLEMKVKVIAPGA